MRKGNNTTSFYRGSSRARLLPLLQRTCWSVSITKRLNGAPCLQLLVLTGSPTSNLQPTLVLRRITRARTYRPCFAGSQDQTHSSFHGIARAPTLLSRFHQGQREEP